ncbi:hypothetical protein IV500_05305 [Paeniglutamicibacter antarcticus]|uniref:Uncharacterized protein n=1 Tax=Arthrobacter terrae TaxID=2935737 RepID=A0A931G9M7_9MICC|nr:hypothetical protein [Arthrobacter terrae]MBG0738837.1 hypothetical protein [Arthrobacter terrae]
MTTDNEARQPKGVPSGGQFAATAHAEPAIALAGSISTAADLKLSADFIDNLPFEHKVALEHWHSRLQGAGVAGELEISSVDGGNTDPGGPTVSGEWRSPDGNQFGFYLDHKSLYISRYDEWNVDSGHAGVTSTLVKGDEFPITDEDLTTHFEHARERARSADGWANRSLLRSNDKFRFTIPERISEGPGHETGQVEITAPNGDEYIVRMDRGEFEARVYGPHEGQLSDRMAAAFLTDVSEACGGNTDPDDLKYAILYSIQAGSGETW